MQRIEYSPDINEIQEIEKPLNKFNGSLAVWELACLIMTIQVIKSRGTHPFLGKPPDSYSLPPIAQYFLNQLVVQHPEIISKPIIYKWFSISMINIFREIVLAIQSNKFQSFVEGRLSVLNLSLKGSSKDLIRIILGEEALNSLNLESLTISSLEQPAKISDYLSKNFLELIEESTIPMHNGQCGTQSVIASLRILMPHNSPPLDVKTTQLSMKYTYDLTGDFGTSQQQDVHFFAIGLNVLERMIKSSNSGNFFYRVHTQEPLEKYIEAYQTNNILLPPDTDGTINSVGNLHYLLSVAIASGQPEKILEMLELDDLNNSPDSLEFNTEYQSGKINGEYFKKKVDATLDQGGHVACLVNWNIYNVSVANQWFSPRHAIVIVGRQGPYWRIYDSSLPNGGMQLVDPIHIYYSLYDQHWIEYGAESDNNQQNYFDQPTIEGIEDNHFLFEIKKWITAAANRSKHAGEKNRYRLMMEIADDQSLLSLISVLLKPLITNENIEAQLRPLGGNIIYAFQRTHQALFKTSIIIDNLTSGQLYDFLIFPPFQELFQRNLSTYPPYSIPDRYFHILKAAYPILTESNRYHLNILDVGSGSMDGIIYAFSQLYGQDLRTHTVNGIDLHSPESSLDAIDYTQEKNQFRRLLNLAETQTKPANVQAHRILADVRQTTSYLEKFGTGYNLIIASFCLHQIGWTEKQLMEHLLPLTDINACLFIHCGIETQTEDHLYEIRAYAIANGSIRLIGTIGALNKDQASLAYQSYNFNNPGELLTQLGFPPNSSLLFSPGLTFEPLNGVDKIHPINGQDRTEEFPSDLNIDELLTHFVTLSRFQYNEPLVDLNGRTNFQEISTTLKKFPVEKRLKIITKNQNIFEFWRGGVNETEQIDFFYFDVLFRPLMKLNNTQLKSTIIQNYNEWRVALPIFENYLFEKLIGLNKYPPTDFKSQTELFSGISLFYKILFFLVNINCIDFDNGEKLYVDDINQCFAKYSFPRLEDLLIEDEVGFLSMLNLVSN
ncbi:MAG: hypothetical protein H6772_00960 [Pseudomonadales bacterium]|nr:hypothetical protein [Pseudomonadales bacterium]